MGSVIDDELKLGFIGDIGKLTVDNKRIWKNQRAFMQELLGEDNLDDGNLSKICKFCECVDLTNINIGDLKERCENSLKKFYSNGTKSLSKNDYKDLNDQLIKLLDTDYIYAKKYVKNNEDKREYAEYSKKDREIMQSFFEMKASSGDIAYHLCAVVYFAIKKELLPNFCYGANYEKDLKDFNEKVLMMYGVTSKQSQKAILSLAEEKNMFALSEMGDMYYYGYGEGIEKNIEKAYHIYKEAAGLVENEMSSFSHPLALWSLAYILFNYKRKRTALECCRDIKELDGIPEKERVRRAIQYAWGSYHFRDENHPPSANILGKAMLLSEEEIEGITEIKKEFNLESAETYFLSAAKDDYMYGITNYALLEAEKIFTEDASKRREHLENYLEYMQKAHMQHNPTGSNELGDFYRTGKIYRRTFIIYSRTSECMDFSDYIEEYNIKNRSSMITSDTKAIEYYSAACETYTTSVSAWACCSLLLYYPEYLKEQGMDIKYFRKIHTFQNEAAIEKLKREWPAERYGNRTYDNYKILL